MSRQSDPSAPLLASGRLLGKELALVVWIVGHLRRTVTCARDQGTLRGEGAIPASKYVIALAISNGKSV